MNLPAAFTAPAVTMLTGGEPILGTRSTVTDFWAWSMSDLRTNTVRPMLAEFLVATALGAENRPRVEWDPYDLTTAQGVTVEVKSSAYLQAWGQKQLSRISFGGLRSRLPLPNGCYAEQATYNAQVYVFALQAATTHDAYDALDPGTWQFWVLPRATLAVTGQSSLGLARVQELAGPPVPYDALAARVTTAHRSEPSAPAAR